MSSGPIRLRASRAWSSSRSAGTTQATSNSRPSGSRAYRLLVVPWSDAPTSAPASPSRAGAGADLEQAEVVVVGRTGRLDEGGPAEPLRGHVDAPEAQHVGVEGDAALEVADVQHRMV